jgi:hypothetical protein
LDERNSNLAIKTKIMKTINFKTLTYTLILFIYVISPSCKKDKENDEHLHEELENPPTIIINSPTENQNFSVGDTIVLSGETTDDSLHELSVSLKNPEGLARIQENPEVHDLASYSFEYSYVLTAGDLGTNIVMVVSVNHTELSTTKMVNINVSE